jgi:hypothetical protein
MAFAAKAASGLAMRLQAQSNESRSGFRALMTVVAILAVATLVKLDAAGLLFHLGR